MQPYLPEEDFEVNTQILTQIKASKYYNLIITIQLCWRIVWIKFKIHIVKIIELKFGLWTQNIIRIITLPIRFEELSAFRLLFQRKSTFQSDVVELIPSKIH